MVARLRQVATGGNVLSSSCFVAESMPEVKVLELDPFNGRLIPFEAFGVRMWLGTNRQEASERMRAVLPPGWRPCQLAEVEEHRLALICDDRGTYAVDIGGTTPLVEGVPLELALEILDATIRARVAFSAPDRIFVHAGVVAHEGRAVLIPGRSFTGKTTLVAALVRAGATYYSDEFAPLDSQGLVHAYAKPLSIRGADQLQTDQPVERLGGMAGHGALTVGAVVVTTHRPGVTWRPKRMSPAGGALALLANTVPARDRPVESLRAITKAVDGAILLEGDRGEADEIAPQLLAKLGAPAS
jgi:hypothetical protein